MSLESSDDDGPPERRGTPSGLNGSPEAELNACKQPEQNGLGKSAPPNHPSAEAAASLSVMSEALDESGVNQRDDSPATVGEVVIDQANIPSDDELSSVGGDDSGHSPSEDGPGTRHSGRRGGRVAEFDPLLDEASSDSSSDAEDPGMPESSQGGDPGGEAGGRRSKREPKKIMDLKPVDLAPPKKNPRRGPKGGKKLKPAATERQASIGRDAEHPIDVDAYAALDVITWTERMAVVVTGIPSDPNVGVVNFDKEGLGTLQQSFKNTISIQDCSIQSGENPNDRLQNGTLEQLLEAAAGPNGKILNALEFPFTEPRIHLQQRFSSDMAAWFATDRPTEKLIVPVKDIRWGLAGLGGSVTHWHVDSDGFCTFIDVLCGLKLWMFGVTPRELASSTSMFLQPAFELSEPNIGRVEGAYDKDAKHIQPAIWELEAVVLPANTRLIMRPNVAHAVFTPEHSICHGGHFYSTMTIQDTAASLIHSFTVGNYITNTSHHPSRLLLRKMMEFYYRGVVLEDVDVTERYAEHLPDPNSVEGFVDLLTVCNLNILGNVLDFRTYSTPNESSDRPATEAQRLLLLTSDVNNIPPEERAHMRYARGMALEVLRWARSQFETRFNLAVVDLPSIYLEHQCRGIVQYKRMVEKGNYEGAPNCTLIGLTAQVKNVLALARNVFALDYDASKLWRQHKIPPEITPENLLLGDLSRFSCVRKKKPGEIRAMTEFQKVGETELDKRSLRAQAGRAKANDAVEERPAKKQRVF
ncbi:hypothetical protein NLJ89_g11055 [Agrocybe chaxingu]|uniref:JmjC domain-containing protein n=1 Tax=Agrocybe chaxingu TaxID=84603 RepID=A0A9W8JX05_9AGAR|nr:hypothetical protein NLJ89_g11055 [Agrocybe chaxingu]